MRTARNYYEILGLPHNATAVQIKRKYKQLVRKYHPDVAVDKELAHRLFLQIQEAYETLYDPARRHEYDVKLNQESLREPQSNNRTRTEATRPPRDKPAGTVAQHLKDAQWSFIQRRFHESALHCKEALKIDPQCAKAHVILGDIYRAQGRISHAVRAYSYAIQYNPGDKETEKKMMDLMEKSNPIKSAVKKSIPNPSVSVTLSALWWSAAFFLMILIAIYPGKPVGWLAYYIPRVSHWSYNLIGFLAGASAIVGMTLSTGGFLAHPDDELVFENTGNNWSVIPTGLILLIGSGFFFLGAAAFYITAGIIQNSLSRSILIVFVAVAILVAVASLMYNPNSRLQVLLYGGNVSFLSMLIGWYVGAMMKPLSES